MEQTVLSKVTRFVELSKKFTKSAEEVLDRADLNEERRCYSSNAVYVGADVYLSAAKGEKTEYRYLNGKVISETPLSKAEILLKEAEIQAQLANEYDEYIQLQKDLSEYLQAAEKLNN